jgi:hypothetical protein
MPSLAKGGSLGGEWSNMRCTWRCTYPAVRAHQLYMCAVPAVGAIWISLLAVACTQHVSRWGSGLASGQVAPGALWLLLDCGMYNLSRRRQ